MWVLKYSKIGLTYNHIMNRGWRKFICVKCKDDVLTNIKHNPDRSLCNDCYIPYNGRFLKRVEQPYRW